MFFILVATTGTDGLLLLAGKAGWSRQKDFAVDQGLDVIHQTAEVEAVAHGVVDLDRQGKLCPSSLLLEPAHGEDGGQIVIAPLEVQVEAGEGGPGDHGYREGVGGRVLLGSEALRGAPAGEGVLIGAEEHGSIRVIGAPEVGEGLRLPVEHGEGGVDNGVVPRLPCPVQGHPELPPGVHRPGQAVEHGGIELDGPLPDRGDIKGYGHAVGAGHLGEVVVKPGLTGPAAAVHGGKVGHNGPPFRRKNRAGRFSSRPAGDSGKEVQVISPWP